jgi:hypothetical protein
MKLYRITIITPSINIERGVWASYTRISDGQVQFLDSDREIIAAYPVNYTMVTSIETKEEYDKRKSSI